MVFLLLPKLSAWGFDFKFLFGKYNLKQKFSEFDCFKLCLLKRLCLKFTNKSYVLPWRKNFYSMFATFNLILNDFMK